MELRIEKVGTAVVDYWITRPLGTALITTNISETGCHEAQNRIHQGSGRPWIHWKGVFRGYAARLIYMLVKDVELTEDQVVRHTCDNPLCVNPEHLLVGTAQDNFIDAQIRDRLARGTNNPNSKLSEDDIKNIRLNRTETHGALAEVYGVTAASISNIRRGKTYNHIYAELIWDDKFLVLYNYSMSQRGCKQGLSNSKAKLTEENIKDIRLDFHTSHAEYARKFGVTERIVKLARYGRSYTNVHRNLIWTPTQIKQFLTKTYSHNNRAANALRSRDAQTGQFVK